VHELLIDHGLPVKLEGTPVERVLETIAHDKKRVGESVPFVLVRAPGDVVHGCAVDPAELRAAVVELKAGREPARAGAVG